MINKKQRIGVFDSGIGGLNVLNNLVEQFPNENFLYLGDNLNVPYGIKTEEELKKIIKKIFNYFEKEQVKAIMIACNTASVASKDLLCNIPVFRIIEPTAKLALKVSNNIGVLATNFTIEAKGYDCYLNNNMVGIKASPFVNIIENDCIETNTSQEVIYNILSPYKNKIDTIILGCTHFSVLENDIKKVLGDDIKIIDSCDSFNDVLKKYLDENNLHNDQNDNQIVTINFTKKDKINTKWFKHPYEGINFINLD